MIKTWCVVLSALLCAAPAANGESVSGFTQGADGVRIHYLESGPPDASRTLLFIPGWRVSATVWSQQLDYFAAHGFRVVAIDSRSQGKSSIAADGNAPENRAGDIQQVVASLHLRHVILVGWSQGVQDVAAYVNRFGTESVDGLALIDGPVSAGPGDVQANPGFLKAVAAGLAVYAGSPRAYTDGLMRAIMHAPPATTSFALLDDEAMRTPVDTGISMLTQDLFTTDRRPYLKHFDKPTLVIASDQSPLLDAQRHMAEAIPHARFEVIKHAAHAVFVDQPAAFDRELEAFADELPARPGQH
jgi:microsomal epoxide hydrolase